MIPDHTIDLNMLISEAWAVYSRITPFTIDPDHEQHILHIGAVAFSLAVHAINNWF